MCLVQQVGSILDVHVAGAACLWIAMKMDGGDAPSAEVSSPKPPNQIMTRVVVSTMTQNTLETKNKYKSWLIIFY